MRLIVKISTIYDVRSAAHLNRTDRVVKLSRLLYKIFVKKNNKKNIVSTFYISWLLPLRAGDIKRNARQRSLSYLSKVQGSLPQRANTTSISLFCKLRCFNILSMQNINAYNKCEESKKCQSTNQDLIQDCEFCQRDHQTRIFSESYFKTKWHVQAACGSDAFILHSASFKPWVG